MAKSKKSRLTTPGPGCGVMDIRCIGPSSEGVWRCTVKCSAGSTYGAVINTKRGSIRFYK